MANLQIQIPPPSTFSIKEDPRNVAHRWQNYIEGFEIYLNCLPKPSEERKINLLLHIAGPEIRELYKTLSPEEETFKSTLEALEKHFTPQINIRYERSIFNSLKFKENETVDMFSIRLKTQGERCKFNDLDDLMVDRIIQEIRSSELRRKLLEKKDLTLNSLLNVSRTHEQSLVQGRGIEDIRKSTADLQVSQVRSSNAKLTQGTQSKHSFAKRGGKSQQNQNQRHFPSQQNERPAYQGTQYRGSSNYFHRGGARNVHNRKKDCFRCGQDDHKPYDKKSCPGFQTVCSICSCRGHLTQRCFSRMKTIYYAQAESTGGPSGDVSQESTNGRYEHFSFQINAIRKARRRIYCDLEINGKPIEMQVDSAADLTVIPENIARQIPNLKLERDKEEINDYNHNPIEVKASAKVEVKLGNKLFKDMPITIVAEEKEKNGVKKEKRALLGLDWLWDLELDWLSILSVQKAKVENEKNEKNDNKSNVEDVLVKYKDVFDPKLGTVKNVEASLELKEDASPKFFSPRQIPFAIKPQVEKEIKRLVEEGNWEKVQYSQWATPLVPIAKPDGEVRLCGDYKVTLNPQLKVAQHPLPNPANMLAALGDCTVFSKLDLKQAFQQLPMDKKSQDYCTINTHLGLFRPKRLPYGVASSPALWQETMDKIFNGLPGIFCFVDDILIAGKNKDEHQERLCKVLDRIKDHDIKINKEKCLFQVSEVEYLGFIIDKDGVHKTKEKVKAIENAKQPENIKELQSFLGLVTFYGKFVKDLATIAHPLYHLLGKDVEYQWSAECNEAFNKIKAELSSNTFLAHYRNDLPVRLVCDASQVGIGSVLAHIMPDGTERPIAYASRLLNKAERNYSQIEKEGLSLVYGVKKFHMYLYGKKSFNLVTDHKPLLAILGSKVGLPTLVAARLQRWAITLAAYNYVLEYRPTSKMGNADALSRLPVDQAPEGNEKNILLIESQNLPIKAKDISQYTMKDPVLSKVLQSMISGRDNLLNSDDYQAYKAILDELSVEQNCILRGARVVIPKALQQKVMKEIHEDHQGIVKSKAIARSFMWWPNMDKDIENHVKQCEICAQNQNNPKAVTIHPWETARYGWQRVHIDYAGPFLGYSYLIVVDAYSKWPEVIPMTSTTSNSTIKALMQLFATHGLPERIVSDNGPQFTSEEFKQFMEINGIKHTLSAPYHPSTNGEAERFVQTFKNAMKRLDANQNTVHSKISKFLLSYRTTPHSATNVAPSFLLMGRRIRSKLDLMIPDYQSQAENKSWKQYETMKNVREFEVSSPVMIRVYNSQNKWVKGIVKRRLGNLHYEIEVDGYLVKRHVDQMKAGIISYTLEKEQSKKEKLPVMGRILPDRESRGKAREILNL